MNDLEKRISDLEVWIQTQGSINDSILDTLKTQSDTMRQMLSLYEALKVEFDVLESETTFKN